MHPDKLQIIVQVMDSENTQEQEVLYQTKTEKGAKALTVDGMILRQSQQKKKLEALLVAWASLCNRGAELSELQNSLINALKESEHQEEAWTLVICALFQLRSVRSGKGEKDLAHTFLLDLYAVEPELILKLVPLYVSEYGCWKDCVKLFQNNATHQPLDSLIVDTVTRNLLKGNPLCAKWLPTIKRAKTPDGNHKKQFGIRVAFHLYKMLRENPSMRPGVVARLKQPTSEMRESPQAFVDRIMNDSCVTKQDIFKLYRLVRSCNNNSTEVLMCQGNYHVIKPHRVPACCLTKHRKAFMNTKRLTDPRRIECKKKFENAFENAKRSGKGINGTVSGVERIVRAYMPTIRNNSQCLDPALEAQWNVLVVEMIQKGTLTKCFPMIDVSGSMEGTAMHVAIGLGLLVAQLAPEPWKNHVMTFEHEPSWLNVHNECDSSLLAKITMLTNASFGMNTNFEAALELLLSVALKYNVPQSGMPETLLVLSDMQFDEAERPLIPSSWSDEQCNPPQLAHAYASLREKFLLVGYAVPHIVFWNLRGDIDAFPCETLSEGVSTLSGFSHVMLETLMDGKMEDLLHQTPWDHLKKSLDNEAFEPVRVIVQNHFAEVRPQ